MTTNRFVGRALPVAEVQTITIADTWATGDTAVLTINGKELTLTVGTDSSTTQVALALKEMWNGVAQASQSGTGDHTFSVVGSTIPECNEITASSSGAVLTLTHDKKGEPFTVTTSETTAGDGTVGDPSVTTAATGPDFFNDADNWSQGTVPADGEDLVIDVPGTVIRNGLTNSSTSPASIYIGENVQIGRPQINTRAGTNLDPSTNNGVVQAYAEYRPTALQIGAVGDAQPITVNIDGAKLVRLNTNDAQTTVNVLATGQSVEAGAPSVTWKGSHASNVVNVTKGTVGVAFFGGETATVATLNQSHSGNVRGDTTVTVGSGTTLTTVNKSGGTLETNCAATTVTNSAGETTLKSGAHTTLNVYGGTVYYRSTGTITTANVSDGGTLDFSRDLQGRTVTNCEVYGGATILDPNKTVTLTNGIDLNQCSLSDVTLDLGAHLRLTRGSVA